MHVREDTKAKENCKKKKRRRRRWHLTLRFVFSSFLQILNGHFFSNLVRSQVLVEEKSSVRILTFNRPKQLNALSFHMVLNRSLAYSSSISYVP